MLNTIQHFTHNHLLTEVNVVGTYTCDGCKLYGHSKTYRCSDCDYDLHEYCATCPRSLKNTWHAPDHELSLYSGPKHMTEHSCYVCRFYIQGMFYKCKQCSFESHPLCTQVPMHASSPDATVTKQRRLHDHMGQPSSLHHYGQGKPFGSAHMSPYVPSSHGGGGHHHHHPHMNPGSPKADSKSGSSTPKTKDKKPGFLGAVKAVAAVTVTVAVQLAVSTVVGTDLQKFLLWWIFYLLMAYGVF